MLDVEAVADLVGLEKATIYMYRWRGTIPPASTGSGRLLWDEEEIREWARAGKVGRFKYE